MYSCPSDDIHSIYLDNELPLAYIKEYEEHLKNCPECAAKLAKLKKMHELFNEDSRSLEKDEKFLDESFVRLQNRLRYSKNTKKININSRPEFKFNEKYVRTGIAAAAAVLVAVIIPVRFSKAPAQNILNVAAVSPIERPNSNASPISTSNIVINGNINDNLAHNVSNGSFEDPQFADVDVFRPEFGHGQIPDNFSIPEFGRPPFHGNRPERNNMDFKSPADLDIISGQTSGKN